MNDEFMETAYTQQFFSQVNSLPWYRTCISSTCNVFGCMILSMSAVLDILYKYIMF